MLTIVLVPLRLAKPGNTKIVPMKVLCMFEFFSLIVGGVGGGWAVVAVLFYTRSAQLAPGPQQQKQKREKKLFFGVTQI